MNATNNAGDLLSSIELQEYRLRSARLTAKLRGCMEQELRDARAEVDAIIEERDALRALLASLLAAAEDGRDQPYHNSGGVGRHYSPAKANRLRNEIARCKGGA